MDWPSDQLAKTIVAGRVEVDVVWEVLDRRYRNTNLAIINTKAKLAQLDTGKREDFDKVEKVRQGVTEARSTLRALGAEEEILNDLALVSSLITKLPRSNQDYWHRYSTGTALEESSQAGLKMKQRQQIQPNSHTWPAR